MMGLGLAAWIGSWFLAYGASDPARGRRRALLAVLVVAAAYGALVGLASVGDATQVRPVRVPQLGLLGLYFLFYGLVPAALGRAFRSPRLAVTVAVLLPLAALASGRLPGVAEGIGRLGDLAFLDPVEMGEGVTQDGRIPHLFRIHWFALGALALAGLAATSLPTPRSGDPR